jgi:hypothetical protein
MGARTPILPALLLTALWILPAAAQEEDDRWSAETAFLLTASGGNEDLTVLTTEAEITHLETSAYEASLGVRFRYGRSEGEDVAQSLQGVTSIDFRPESRWSPFLFATAENDRFKKLDLRFNGGAGLKHTFWQDDWDEVSLSGAVLYDYENLELEETEGDGVTQSARWSWRGRVRTEFGEGRRFEQTVFFQPVWDQFDDYLLESRTSARWALNTILAFTTGFVYQRDSTPAPEVEADDWSVQMGLTLATRW